MKYKQKVDEDISKKPFSVREIFEDHWEDYSKQHPLREIEKKEVEKMLSCKGPERGGYLCYCKKCDREEFVPFGCNSRLCSSCGKRYTDKWAAMLAGRLFDKIIHRHMVFTLPEIIWGYVGENRRLQKVIMDASYATIKDLFCYITKKAVIPGVVAVLHPFGRDLMFKPHTHCIVTGGGFTEGGEFVSIGQYLHYNSLHKKWQYNALTSLRKYLPREIIDICFENYPEGFVAYIKSERIYSKKRMIQYIGRYVRHPAIANTRIIDYTGKGITFYYDDNYGKRHFKTMYAYDFISAIIQHIPDENQRLVRYYGAYSRNTKHRVVRKSSVRQSILLEFRRKKRFCCSICKEEMEILAYIKKPPPKDMSKLSSWID